jgi:hypothetical protein
VVLSALPEGGQHGHIRDTPDSADALLGERACVVPVVWVHCGTSVVLVLVGRGGTTVWCARLNPVPLTFLD